MGALFGVVIGAAALYYSITGAAWLIAWIVGLLRNGFSFSKTREEFRFLSEELRDQQQQATQQARRAWEQKQRKL